ncbi:MAG: hypothetical protein Unbinned838contig1000_24 [Prokaryotic dsDNA virus sp.]|nr:MAG: hypothetical protein Unbinned838contig1000_24 [Prokaryotic dsDNA virus sp.]|tara:strand:+ start:14460 stop:15656 length:1197 start_codon:yes stop_codon:yes gene_type:complete
MSENTNDNPLDGFKNLAAEIMPAENLEVQEVASVPEENLTETLGADTGVKDLTNTDLTTDEVEHMDDDKEEKKEEEKKETLSADNLEIAYKEEMVEEEDVAEESVAESDSEEVSQLGVLANYLKEEGVIDFDDEEFEDSEDGIKSLIENEIKKGVSKYKEDLPALAQEFIEYIDKGGDPQNFVKATSDVDFSRIDPKMVKGKENLQKQLVAELMRREGFTQDEILSDIQDFVDGGLIEKRASRALSKLKSMQANERKDLLKKQEESAQAKEAEYTNFLTSLKDDIASREEIAGFPVSKKAKKDFYDYITKPDRKTGKTRLVMDSEADQDSQLKMAWLYYNKFDFSKVEKKARTKATSSLKASLERASGVSSKKLKSKTRTKATGNDIDFSLFENALKI